MIKKFEDPAALPHRAPMYKSDAAVLEEFRRENPDLIATESKKDDPLHDRLKAVYVSSTDPAPDPRLGETENKPLPRDVRQHYDVGGSLNQIYSFVNTMVLVGFCACSDES